MPLENQILEAFWKLCCEITFRWTFIFDVLQKKSLNHTYPYATLSNHVQRCNNAYACMHASVPAAQEFVYLDCLASQKSTWKTLKKCVKIFFPDNITYPCTTRQTNVRTHGQTDRRTQYVPTNSRPKGEKYFSAYDFYLRATYYSYNYNYNYYYCETSLGNPVTASNRKAAILMPTKQYKNKTSSYLFVLFWSMAVRNSEQGIGT